MKIVFIDCLYLIQSSKIKQSFKQLIIDNLSPHGHQYNFKIWKSSLTNKKCKNFTNLHSNLDQELTAPILTLQLVVASLEETGNIILGAM